MTGLVAALGFVAGCGDDDTASSTSGASGSGGGSQLTIVGYSVAREVNAAPFLDERLTRCRTERKLLPNVVAVDFYRQGDVFGAVKRLTPGG